MVSLQRRWPAFAGVAYALMGIVGLFVVPAPPEVSASGARLVAYFQAHAHGVRFSTWLGTLTVLPFVPIAAALRNRLVGIGRDVMFLGAAGVAIETSIWSWVNGGLALHPSTLNPDVARTVFDVGAFYGPTLTVFVIMFAAPIGVAAWRSDRALPRWLAWVTVVLVVEQVIETVTVFGTHGFIAPGGPMNLALGAGLYLLWLLAAAAAISIGDVSTGKNPV
jgi:hypothetical protein